MDIERLKADFSEQGFELHETHISLVFLKRERVYKVKKPVSLGFLDFSTLPKRRAACIAEVDLNRRLAPGVYLGLRGIGRDERGSYRLLDSGATDTALEHAVEMVRLPDEASAESLIAVDALTVDHVRALARRLSDFHRHCSFNEDTARYGEVDVIEGNVRENFAQTRETAPSYLDVGTLSQIEVFQRNFLTQRAELFEERARRGFVRDGHGDLRLEHVYFVSDKIEIIDCIEFSDRFRYADVCADMAFLAMDLCFHERSDLSELLLSEYARETNDYDLYALVDFYTSYRAFVRAKVTTFTEQNSELSEEARERLHAQARKYFMLAAAEMKAPLQSPLLVVVHGRIASGKSTLAEKVGLALSAPVLSTDRTRKHLNQVGALESMAGEAFQGAYSEEMTARTYAETMRRAGVVLNSLRPVVFDATCSKAQQRAGLIELAESHGVPVLFVECLVSDEVCRARLRKREQGPSVSDGRIDILDEFMARYESPDEIPASVLVRVETEEVDDALVEAVLSHPALTAD